MEMINSWFKEIMAMTVLALVLFYVFRNGGKDFNTITTGLTSNYATFVGALTNPK